MSSLQTRENTDHALIHGVFSLLVFGVILSLHGQSDLILCSTESLVCGRFLYDSSRGSYWCEDFALNGRPQVTLRRAAEIHHMMSRLGAW